MATVISTGRAARGGELARPPAWLADRAWPQVARGQVVLIPVGSLEQHGPHLPLDTDTVIATAVCARLAPALGAVAAPAVAYGSSGEHQGFPGTASVGRDALTATLVQVARSVTTWASRVVFVNGHGGNLPSLHRATHLLRIEGRDVSWFPCQATGGDAHAGRTETSLMLHLDPGRVQLDHAVAGNTGRLSELMPTLLRDGVAAVSPTGILGDPSGANRDEGQALLGEMVRSALRREALTR